MQKQSNFKTYKATVIRIVWNQYKARDHWNRIDNSEIDPCRYHNGSMKKKGKQLSGTKEVFPTNGLGILGNIHGSKPIHFKIQSSE